MNRFFATIAAIISTATSMSALVDIPAFVNMAADSISISTADATQRAAWRHVASRLDSLERNVSSSVVRILHIGDSHIQAEFVTNALRSKLQDTYGNAGRGLVSPLRLAGTNQPIDYAITAPDAIDWRKTRLLNLPWDATPGVTGIAAQPVRTTTATIKALKSGHRITRATILTANGVNTYTYTKPQDSISVNLDANEALYGVILENGQPGVLYSAIGNNGACFTDYLLIPGFAKDTEVFHPDLIILSMGTNEGFSYMTDAEIQRCTADLIRLLRNAHPKAAMLVLTPMECQINRNHGYRPLSSYYDINEHVADAAHLILESAKGQGIPVWDFYHIAGGHGASNHWIKSELFSKDRIHLNAAGYQLQADLIYSALRSIFNSSH